MKDIRRKVLGFALALGTMMVSTGCDDFLDVTNPNNLEAENVDPDRDSRILAQSVYQAFISDYGDYNLHSAWFTNEARVGDTFPTRNQFGRRDVDGAQGGLWSNIHDNMQFARTVIRSIEGAGNTIDLAKSYFVAGASIMLEAEMFCEGTIAQDWLTPRGPMTSLQLLDSAIAYLSKAQSIAAGLSGSEAAGIAGASQVVIARAHLQAGRKAEASTAAGGVAPDFEFYLWHLDDPSNRGLGNDLWAFSESRISLVVGPEWRAMADAGDPRIGYVDMGRVAQDGVLNFFRQDKIKGWGDDDRYASGLEARYIKIEADGNPAAMLAFINERRAVGGQDPISSTDPQVLIRELMEQKARDFWLEGKRIADLRRLGEDVLPYIIPPGDNYYKPELGIVGTEVCWPVPQSEMNNNPHWNP